MLDSKEEDFDVKQLSYPFILYTFDKQFIFVMINKPAYGALRLFLYDIEKNKISALSLL